MWFFRIRELFFESNGYTVDKFKYMDEQPISISLDSSPENVSEIQPYVDRIVQKYQVVHVNSQFDKDLIRVKIQDEGEGFDFEDVPDPTDPMNILTLNGRGVFLMHQLSDGVEYSDNGSTVEIKFKL